MRRSGSGSGSGSATAGRRRARSEEMGEYEEDGKRHKLAIPVCKDFSRGRCSRSTECRYAHHPPMVAVEGEQVTVCYDSLRDRCARGLSCRYFHPPSHIRVVMQQAVGIQPSPVAFEVRASGLLLAPAPSTSRPSIQVCRDFARGRCKREAHECRFAHHISNTGDGENATVCQDFMRGVCERGACRYFHPPQHLRRKVRDLSTSLSSTAGTLGLYGAYVAGDSHPAKRMRLEEALPGRHLPNVSEAQYDEDKLPVCRDYLRNKCDRDVACRYVHPAPHAQVVDGYVTLCRDSTRGRCRREACRFHHPKQAEREEEDDECSFGDDYRPISPIFL